MPKKSNVPLRRLSLNLPVSLVERIDEYAENIGIPRNIAINVLINQRLEDIDRMTITQDANSNLQTIFGNPTLMQKMLEGK